MIVTIDDACTACGLCCDTCPEVFRMGDDIAEVYDSEVPEEHQAQAEQAAEECPVGAIQIDL
ncbi:ferredoxin [Planctomycetota bacterium]